jgi:hypothetical protein
MIVFDNVSTGVTFPLSREHDGWRRTPNAYAAEAFDLHAFEEIAGRMGVAVPEYRPA